MFASIFEEGEFDTFVKTLMEKLPVTFRINSGELHFEKVSAMLKDPGFIENYAKIQEEEAPAAEENKDEAGETNPIVDETGNVQMEQNKHGL